MIKTLYPFELKNINSIDEYLFILKNCLRLIRDYDLSKKSSGIILSLSYSNKHKNWLANFSPVVSSKANIMLTGNCLNENSHTAACYLLLCLIKDESFKRIAESYKLNRNYNRSILFIFENNSLHVLGLFSFNIVNNKYKYKQIDCLNINKELLTLNKYISSLNVQTIKFDYIKEYNKFVSCLKQVKIVYLDNNTFLLEDNLLLKKDKKATKLLYSEYSNMIDNKHQPNSRSIFYYTLYMITLEFTKYINKNIITNAFKDIDFILNDVKRQVIIKLPSRLSKPSEVKKEKILLPPLMPVSF
jgi:hypothetical protein